VRNAKRLKYAGVGERLVKQPLFVSLEPDGSDVWRLDPVVDLLDKGGVSSRSRLVLVACQLLHPAQPLAVCSQASSAAGPSRCSAVASLTDAAGCQLQVGIIPTDTLPAVVCDLENRDAVLKLYNVMELAPKKQLR
jgi:hypothetical protein